MAELALFAAVVNRNAGAELAGCVRSLREFLAPDRIVVVDCGSTDGSLETLGPGDAQIEKLGKNRGYAGGNNRALQLVSRWGGRLALIINPDARIDPHGAAMMAELLQDDRSVGAAFPIVRRADRPRELEAAFGVINFRHRLVRMAGQADLDKRKRTSSFDVDFGLGCCFMVRVRTFFEVGGFDEGFFAYHDEPDLCHRLRDVGLRSVLVPGATAYHRGIEANEAKTLAKEYLVARNSVLFMKKHGGIFRWSKFLLFLAAAVIAWYPGAAMGDGLKSKRLQGFRDGFSGETIRPEIMNSM